MKLSDYVISFLTQKGVKDIFMVTGGGAMHLNDSIGNNKDLTYYCNHHEQASAIAAEAYARLKGLGACNITTGPGGTNTITGLVGAWLDSIPLVFISGQVKRETIMPEGSGLRQLGVQELNIVDVVRPITKYAVLVANEKEIKYHLEKAIFLATTGRPGPVWLDIPLDIQAKIVEPKVLKGFRPTKKEKNIFDKTIVRKQVKEVIKLLKKSNRPVILAGGGVRLADAKKELLEFAEKMQIPVLTGMSSHDLIPSSHNLFFGRPGVFGERVGNFIVQNSDLVISIGSRLHLWIISYDYKNFARGAKKVIVDIDPAELNKPTIKPDVPIKSDAGFFLEEMIRQTKKEKIKDASSWIKYCRRIRANYHVVLPEYEKEKKWVNSYYFTEVLSKLLKDDEVIVTANGTAFTGTLQSIKLKKNQRLISNIGCASMGYDLPAAIGACIANDKKRVICIAGDGSIQMNIQELQTIVNYKLPIKIFILNNDGYLAIRNTQDGYFKSRYYGADKDHGVGMPDMVKIGKAYGIPSLRISNQHKLGEKIKKALDMKGPVICDIMMSPKQPLIPKVTSEVKPDGRVISKPLEDMYPFLEREEFYNNMIIEPLKED